MIRAPGMLLAFALVVSAAVAARLVYRYDLYDREPWPIMAAVVAAGAAAMFLLGGAEDLAIQVVGRGQPSAADIAAVAAVMEELARLAIVVALAVFVPRHFNDPMDGLIYGSTVGIGMAIEETTIYLAREAAAPAAVTFSVELVRLFGHIVMGGITGFGVGMLHHHPAGRSWIWIASACLTTGVGIHFLWDYLALSSVMHGDTGATTAAIIALLAASMAIYGGLVVAGSHASRRKFAPDSDARVWRRRGGRR
jgi:RsiW-degrading membrane proteinase PrsW (M82 family)